MYITGRDSGVGGHPVRLRHPSRIGGIAVGLSPPRLHPDRDGKRFSVRRTPVVHGRRLLPAGPFWPRYAATRPGCLQAGHQAAGRYRVAWRGRRPATAPYLHCRKVANRGHWWRVSDAGGTFTRGGAGIALTVPLRAIAGHCGCASSIAFTARRSNGVAGTPKTCTWNQENVYLEPKKRVPGTKKTCTWNQENVYLEPRKWANLGVSQSLRNGLTMGFFGLGNA